MSIHERPDRSASREMRRWDEALLRALVDDAVDGIVVIDERGIVQLFNAAGERMFGYRAEEILGQDISRLMPEPYRSEHGRYLDNYLTTGHKKIIGIGREVIGRRKDGNTFPMYLSVSELRQGGRRLFAGMVQDLTARKWGEERLRRSEEQLRLTLENAPIGIATLDLEGRLLSVNPAFCAIVGYSAEELAGMSVAAITHPDDCKKVLANHQSLIRGDVGACELEQRWVRRDGTITTVCAHAGLVRDVDGEPMLIVGEFEDINDRTRAAQEMQRMRAYLANIINSMPSILVGVDTQDRITEWNRGAEAAKGMPASEAVGRGFAELFPELESQLEKVHEAVHRRTPLRSERFATETEGELRYADVMVYPLLANGVEGAVIRVDDITDRVRMEQMMVQTEKMMSVGGLAAGMAHEINNPLSGVLQSCQNIQRRLSSELPANRQLADSLGLDLDTVRRYLQQRGVLGFVQGIQEAGARASRIVTDMLSFSRGSTGEVEAVRVDEMLETVIRLAASDYDLKKKYDFKQVEILREYDSVLEPVPCDRTEIEQVFLNLIKNAAQAMVDGGPSPYRITLRTRREGEHARIEVQDNGPGMDEQTRRRVFEPFYTTKPAGVGTGLGLSVSYFIVTEQHRGDISVSSAPGQGACFVIRLPFQRRAA